MLVLELKNDLHRQIVETDDSQFLEMVQQLFIAHHKGQDWWLLLSEKDRAMLEKSIQQKAAGQGMPHLEVRREIDLILRKAAS